MYRPEKRGLITFMNFTVAVAFEQLTLAGNMAKVPEVSSEKPLGKFLGTDKS